MSKDTNDFLVEIGTEELPPKELPILATQFAELLKSYLADAGIQYGETKTFASPRRIATLIKDLPTTQPDQTISKSGPSIKAAYDAHGQATKAALGFASSCNISLAELVTKDDKLYFEKKVAGQKTINLLPAMIEKALSSLPAKKAMRWAQGEITFVRPIHWILMLFGSQAIKTTIWGINTDNLTYGHRIHHPEPIKIDSADQYERRLEQAFVIADYVQRQKRIKHQIEEIAKREQAIAKIDDGLLEMVTGLVEWPAALVANFKPEFLRVPKECLISAMQEHQKCFALLDTNGNLLPKFVLISNIESIDPGTVIRGNELVMHARLADAAFHFDNDQKQSLANHNEGLKTVIYQKKLGSIYDKTLRIQKLANFIANKISADIDASKRAAELCKADLLTSMVYEFPELQGIMGYYYAKHDGESEAVALAIQEHYLPKFAGDTLPQSKPGICLALADRVDSLVGLFSVGSVPTGDKDPFGLRRQAIAVLRILIEKGINLDLKELFTQALSNYNTTLNDANEDLLAFCLERLKAWYLEKNISAKTFAAVAANNISSPLDFDKRIHAVKNFQSLSQAESLAAANKRVQNILSKSPAINAGLNNSLLAEPAEKALFSQIEAKTREITPLLEKSDYTNVLKSLATLQTPVDEFFEHVMVMVDDEKIRNNRLSLLQQLRNLFLEVADVSLL